MKNAILLTLNTLKITFRKKSSIIVFLIIPILTTLLSLNIYGSTTSKNLRIGIVDNDNSKLSKDMIESIRNTEKFNVINIDEKDLKEKVAAKMIDCAFIIPRNFSVDVYNNTLKDMEIVSIKGEDTTAWIKNYINSYIKNLLDISIASQGKKEIFNKIYDSYKNENVILKVNKVEDQLRSKNVTMQSIGFLVMFMLISSSNISRLILKEKRNRTYFRILSSPVNARSYILGNVIANVIILFAQISVVLLVASKIFKINTFVTLPKLLAILMCFGLVCIAIGIVIIAFSSNSAQAGNLSTLIITPTCMLGGCFWEIGLMPKSIQKISNFIPQKWVLDAITKLQGGATFSDISMNIAIILAFALALFLIAIYKLSHSDDVKNFI